MRSDLRIKAVGLSVSATVAVLYIVIMLASLLLVGFLTTGSLQAVFLGITWSTVAGFELGLVVLVSTGFALAVVFVPAYNSVQRRLASHSKSRARRSQPGAPAAPLWPVRLLTACLVLPALILLLLHALATAASPGVAPDAAGVAIQGPREQMQPVTMSHVINTAHREAEPSFTADERTMYFNCNNADICVSRLVSTWEEGRWTTPERLGAPISTEYEEVEPIINGAGDKLYFTSNRPGGLLKSVPFLSPFLNVFTVINYLTTARFGRSYFDGLGTPDVWVSERVDGVWLEPRNLNNVAGEPPINTEFADHCLFFSADGNEAFWTSTRPGGFGDNDIWTSRRVNGTWSEPENLGSNVNGPGSEHTSIPTPDGRSLYVTATHAEGFGGEDIYVTTRGADGAWGTLLNLGPQVNGEGDDRCLAWTPDLKIFLFDSVREGGFGSKDIWWVYFEEVMKHAPAAVSDNAGVSSP